MSGLPAPALKQLQAAGMTIGPDGLIKPAGGMGGMGGCFGGMGAMGGGKGGAQGGGGGMGEVRFQLAESAQVAAQALNGSMIMGQQITVTPDVSSKDGTKVLVSGLGPGVKWQELKDHFAQAGAIAFAGTK